MRHFVFGDIHGHARAFHAILSAVQIAKKDRITLLGDYIDHGPESRAVLDTLMFLGEQATPLSGNHEAMLLSAIDDEFVEREWLRHGGDATLLSFGVTRANQIPQTYIDWLQELPLYREEEGYLFTHATPSPNVPIAEQSEEQLLWQHAQLPVALSDGRIPVCGHTPHTQPVITPTYINLDTGIASGGWLSCYELTSGRLVQSDRHGTLLDTEVPLAA